MVHAKRTQEDTGQNQAQQAWQLQSDKERTEQKTDYENKSDTVDQNVHLQIFPLKKLTTDCAYCAEVISLYKRFKRFASGDIHSR